ncbi:MAG: sigma-70 family RNA polymerase sigma factor [Alistipes sp.]|nr:sigma-70 family RNA polymerase sigma factor [Alistipes sp.]
MNTETEYIELVARMRETVYRLARSITLNDAEAEDITQDVFEKVWRSREIIMHSDYPRAYICRMAHNLAIDRCRERVRKQEFEGLERQNVANNGDATTDISDMAALTLRLINRLPEKQRVTIHLRDVEGYEIEEIAKVVGCDDSSVRMNLSRARKTLREQIIAYMNYGV